MKKTKIGIYLLQTLTSFDDIKEKLWDYNSFIIGENDIW